MKNTLLVPLLLTTGVVSVLYLMFKKSDNTSKASTGAWNTNPRWNDYGWSNQLNYTAVPMAEDVGDPYRTRGTTLSPNQNFRTRQVQNW